MSGERRSWRVWADRMRPTELNLSGDYRRGAGMLVVTLLLDRELTLTTPGVLAGTDVSLLPEKRVKLHLQD